MIKKVSIISALAVAALLVISISVHKNSLEFGSPAFAGCFASDVRTECCPQACAVKKKDNSGDKHDRALKACMANVMSNCSSSDISNSTVQNTCNCN
ncbi:MAG: hypothetical protein GY754_40950 [bacterium]|nr:hypothetical protein [bacterium]